MHVKTAVLFCLATLSCAWASDTAMDRDTLRGLKTIKVVVDPTGKDLEAQGITADKLRVRLEGRLDNGGIKLDPNAKEFLGMRVLAAHSRRTPYAVCVTLDVYQIVSLGRDPKIKTTTATWGIEDVLMIPPKQLEQAISDSLDHLVGQFLSSWKSANQ